MCVDSFGKHQGSVRLPGSASTLGSGAAGLGWGLPAGRLRRILDAARERAHCCGPALSQHPGELHPAPS